jgi:hypothetical protein
MLLPYVQFSVRWMMAAVAVIALAIFYAEMATLLLILAISSLAIRSLFTEPVGRRSRRWAIPYLLTLACLYLPLGWVAWYHPWEGSRWAGVKFWPVSPGLSAGLYANSFLFEYYPDERTIALAMAAGAVFRITVFTTLGSLGRAAMVMANLVALVSTVLESWLYYNFSIDNVISPYHIVAWPSWMFVAEFLFAPSSGVLSVGFLLFIRYLWKRIKPRKPAHAPGYRESGS